MSQVRAHAVFGKRHFERPNSTHYKGYISLVARLKDNSDLGVFSERFKKWIRNWNGSKDGKQFGVSGHWREDACKAFSNDHVHAIWRHYRNCQDTQELLLFLQRDPDVQTFVWQEVCCAFCAFKYILRGLGDKRKIASRHDNIRAPDSCPHFNGIPSDDDSDQENARDPFVSLENRSPNQHSKRGNFSGRSVGDQDATGQDAEGGAPSGISSLSKSQRNGVMKMKWARDIIEKHGITDYSAFVKTIAFMDDDDILDLHTGYALNKDYDKQVAQQIRLVKIRHQYTDWIDLADKVRDNPLLLSPGIHYASVKESCNLIRYWFYSQDLDPRATIEKWEEIINRKKSKQNFIYLYGEVNAFKSKILQSICRSLIYTTTLNGVDKTSIRFAFAPAVYDRATYWDEMRASDATHDQIKSIAGGDRVFTDVKYQDLQAVDRVPLLASSNVPCWSGVAQTYKESFNKALQARGFVHHCRSVPGGDRFEGDIHPAAWSEMLRWCRDVLYEAESYPTEDEFTAFMDKMHNANGWPENRTSQTSTRSRRRQFDGTDDERPGQDVVDYDEETDDLMGVLDEEYDRLARADPDAPWIDSGAPPRAVLPVDCTHAHCARCRTNERANNSSRGDGMRIAGYAGSQRCIDQN